MSAYIFISVLTAFVGSAYGLVAYGNGIWTILGWYLVGGWTGIALVICAFLSLSLWRGHSLSPAT